MAIKKYRIAVFGDGEFSHGYDWENRKPKLKRNREQWIAKIEENNARDSRVDKERIAVGRILIHYQSKEVRTNLNGCIEIIESLT